MLAFIDLVQEEEQEKYGDAYVPPSKENPAGSQGKITSEPSKSGSQRPRSPMPLKAPFVETLSPKTPSSASKVQPSHPEEPSLVDFKITDDDSWRCDICTLSNPTNYLVCDACGTERPESTLRPQAPPRPWLSGTQQKSNRKPPSKVMETLRPFQTNKKPEPPGWVCHTCGRFMEGEWWTCASCGSMKLSS